VGEADDSRQDLVDPDDDLLAVDRGERRQPQVPRPVVVLDRDPAVLRMARSTMFRLAITFSRLIIGVATAWSTKRMSWSWPSMR